MLNPNLKLIPVSKHGYSNSDLSGYYGGTYLIYKDGDDYEVVLCHGYSDGVFQFDIRDPVEDETKLFRFIPEQGFYYVKGTGLVNYSYRVRKTYKKSLAHTYIKAVRVSDESPRISTTKLIKALVETDPPIKGDTFVISRRLCVSSGKLITAYKGLTVGDYKDGVAVSPIGAICDRINETGVIQCQLP